MVRFSLPRLPMRGAERIIFTATLAATAAACGVADPHDLTGGSTASDSSAYEGIDYELTSENYRKWVMVNAMLDSVGAPPAARVSTIDPSDDEIEAVVEALESDTLALALLDSVDLEPKDYVLTTIALAQSWDAVNRPGTIANAPVRNVEFVRERAATDEVVRSRPRSRFVDDDRPRKRGKGKGRGRGRGKRD